MTSGPHDAATHPHLRLRLKPKGPTTGYVDGAWWPRSQDLTAELPGLAEVLAVRLGGIERVAYAMSTWERAPRRFGVAGHRVSMEGFTYQDQNVIHVTGSNRGRLSLLVVPPDTAEAEGHDAMMAAAHRGNTDRTDQLLAPVHLPAQRQKRASSS